MSYRDELDAAQARIEALERELAETRAALSGSRALVKVGSVELATRREKQRTARRWLGGPTRLEAERTIEGAAPETCYGEIVDYLSLHFEIGCRISTVAGRFEWTSSPLSSGTGPSVTVVVTSRDGQTTVRAHEPLSDLLGSIYGGFGGGVGGAGIIAPIALFALSPILGAIGVPLWIGGTYALCRSRFRRSVNERETRLEEAVAGVADIIRAAAEPQRTESRSSAR